MKVFLNNKFQIERVEDKLEDALVKGSTKFDLLSVYIPTELKESFSSIAPMYSVKRADGRKLGPYGTLANEEMFEEDLSVDSYYGWAGYFNPRDLGVKGALEITIAFIINDSTIKTATMVTTNVVDAIEVDDDIFVIGDNQIVTSLVESVKNLLVNSLTMANDVVQNYAALTSYPTVDLPDGFRVLVMNDSNYDNNPVLYQWNEKIWENKGYFDWSGYLDTKFNGYKETLDQHIDERLDAQDERITTEMASITQPKYYTTLPTTDVGLIVYSDGYIYSWDGTQYVSTGILYQAPLNVSQDTGDSESIVMSQDAVSEELNKMGNFVKSFSNYNSSLTYEVKIFQSVSNLVLFTPEYYLNKEIHCGNVGWYNGIGIYISFYYVKNNQSIVFKTWTITSLNAPTGKQTYDLEDKLWGFKVHLTVDWNILGTSWYNSLNSNLIVKNVKLYYGRYFEQTNDKQNLIIGKTPNKNLFDFNKIIWNKRRNDGVDYDDDTRYIIDKIAVEPNKIYKTSLPFTYFNYYNANGAWTRTTAVEGQTIITTQNNEYFVSPSGLQISGNPENLIIQEVMSSEEIIDGSCLYNKEDNISAGNFALSLAKGYEKGIFNIGLDYTDETNLLDLALESSQDEKLIAFPMTGEYEGIITNIKIPVVSDTRAYLIFGVGTIDQRGWGLIRKWVACLMDSNYSSTNKYNNIYLNLDIKKGERLFYLCSGTQSTAYHMKMFLNTKGYHYESDVNGINMTKVTGSICAVITINGKRYVESSIASSTDVASIKQDVSTLQSELRNKKLNDFIITSPNDTYFKLSVGNDGSLSTTQIPTEGKILIMGNSYDVHGYVAGLWWGDFGMAASRKSNDWKHLLISRLLNENSALYSFEKCPIASWETTWTNFDYSAFDYAFEGQNYSLVIVRIGENNTDSDQTRNKNRMIALLNYINSKTGGTVPIIVGGSLKYRTENNVAFAEAVATISNATYVDMQPAGLVEPFAAGLNYRVLGDDNVWHTISESSQAEAVAGHPNDNVMSAMCDLLYPVVIEKLLG